MHLGPIERNRRGEEKEAKSISSSVLHHQSQNLSERPNHKKDEGSREGQRVGQEDNSFVVTQTSGPVNIGILEQECLSETTFFCLAALKILFCDIKSDHI